MTATGEVKSAKTSAEVLTPEALADQLIPDAPMIAPDGLSVVFGVAPASKKDEHPVRGLWIGRHGEPARRLTSGEWHDGVPDWSPDGARLVFTSDRVKRGEDHGLYVLPIAGGEAIRLGELAGELKDPAWSPDGASIALLRTDPKTDEQKQREKDRDDVIVVDRDMRFTHLWLVDADSGKARRLTAAQREVHAFRWLPDGSGLLVVTSDLPTVDSGIEGGDLWEVPAHGGLARKIAHFPVAPGTPLYVESTTGPAVVVAGEGGRSYPTSSVWMVPLAGGEPENLLPGWPGAVNATSTPGRDRSQVALQTVQGVHAGMHLLDLQNRTVTALGAEERRDQGSIKGTSSFSRDGSRVAYVWSDSSTPDEVYLGNLHGAVSAVTEFGKTFSGALQPAETVRWTSSDGVAVEGVLVYPVNYQAGQRYPLIVEIHGGPSWQWEDRVMLDWHDWAQMLAANGFAVLLPNPRGSTSYGADFERLLQNDVGNGECQDLISGALAMVDRGLADPERLGIGGWSWGGYLTARTITETDIFKAAIMGAGLCNLISDHGTDDIPSANLLYFPGHPYEHFDSYWNASPIKNVTRVKTPTLILHGDADARVPPSQGQEFYRALKVLNVPVEFVRYPREGHPIEERLHQIDLMQRVLGWFKKYLTTV